jgi:drug/metabolite transporter (DMT)-like permease
VAGLLVFVAMWALVDSSLTAAGLHGLTGWQVVFTRYTVHLAIVLVLWGKHAPWRTRRPRMQLVRSAMMLVMPASYLLALTRGAPIDWVMTIFWSSPLQLLIYSAVFERERAGATTWIAALLGWLAAWIYYAPQGLPTRGATVFGLAMGASFGLYVAMTRDLRDEPLHTNLFYTAVVPWAGLLPAMGRLWVSPPPSEIAVLVFIGAAGWIALLGIDRSAEAAPVSDTAPLLYLQIGIAALIALPVGHHPPALRLAEAAGLLSATLATGWFGLTHRRIARPE